MVTHDREASKTLYGRLETPRNAGESHPVKSMSIYYAEEKSIQPTLERNLLQSRDSLSSKQSTKISKALNGHAISLEFQRGGFGGIKHG